jgi:small conductance mechanosensitive channel
LEDWVANLKEWAFVHGWNILLGIVLFVVGRIAISIVIRFIRRLLHRSQMDATLTRFILSMTNIVLLVMLVIVVLDYLGIETTSFVAILGAAGLAVGFALQSSLSNFASGVMLITFRPFKAGDFIEAGGISGIVEEISIFNTVMRSPDNKRIIVPNGQITGGNIINYSAMETRRVDLVFGIGYGDDIKKAKNLLECLVKEDSRILTDPAPVIAVGELADSSVNFVVRPWVKTADYWDVYWSLTEKVKMTFDVEGISIPFPQRDVHLYQEKKD